MNEIQKRKIFLLIADITKYNKREDSHRIARSISRLEKYIKTIQIEEK